METTTEASKRQPLPPPSPSSSVPAYDLERTHHCTAGGDEGCGASCSVTAWDDPSPPPAGPGQFQVLWSLWLVVACLSFPTLVFVSGVYRAPLVFLSGISVTSATSLQQHEERVPDEVQHSDAAASPINTAALELHSITAPSPSPISGEKPTYAVVPVAKPPAPAPAPATVADGTRSSVAQLHKPGMVDGATPSSDAGAHDDKLLSGLLAPGFDEGTCLSRYESYAYRKASPHKPSPYLLHKLRKYEVLHRRCGPHSHSYKRSLYLLKPGAGKTTASAPCKYLVWNAENGLGNRMLSMASAFLYALLSSRVLLIDRSTDLDGLFCEPFPRSTWMLPLDFPLQHLPLGQKYPESYGNLLRTDRIRNNGSSAPAFVYAHLSNDYGDYDRRFYCEVDQIFMEKIPWLMLRSDQYFVPALFLNPAFERELLRMFPEKEAAFHHLGRYLFHPSDKVWGLITGYYREHLAGARETLGIQIRVFDNKLRPFDLILRQILNCTVSEKLLPDVDSRRRRHAIPTGDGPTKAVLLASLHSVFYDKMKQMYSGHPTARGEVISFHQPSHEEEQLTGKAAHDRKALAEIYLLSLVDALVTSSWSTFGYVAQGLGGVTPWVLRGPVHEWVPEPACVRDLSPEPCFHFPPNYDCQAGTHADMAKLLPYTRHCRDFRRGVKLVKVSP